MPSTWNSGGTNRYKLGAKPRFSITFKDTGGTLIDPAVVKFTVQDPAGVETTYTYGTDAELVKDSTGTYHIDIDADQVGHWHGRWWSTGTGQGAVEGAFVVLSSEFAS